MFISDDIKNALYDKPYTCPLCNEIDTPHATYNEYTTIEEAILKHKLALVACITRKSKIGEQAYISLYIAWLYRDLGNTHEAHDFLERAYAVLCEAFSTDSFPILGMDELTFTYLIAAVAYELDKKEACKQYLSTVLSAVGFPPRIKDHALNLKQKLVSVS